MRKITRFTFLSFYLNSLLDKKKLLNIDETKKNIEEGTIFNFLKNNFGDDIDLSLYRDEDKKVMTEFFQSLINAVDEKRKMGIEYNGLALLIAYCLEGIQRLD